MEKGVPFQEIETEIMAPVLETVKINGYIKDLENPNKSFKEKLCDTTQKNSGNPQCPELTDSALTKIPENFAQTFLDTLTLNLENSQLESFPSSISSIENLQTLKLNGNNISNLPSSLENFKFLKTLDLSNNAIEELPDNIGDLISLQTLNLGWNKLSKLPANCVKLNRLVNLNLCHNNLCRIPNSVTTGMKSLEFLDVSSNNPKMSIHHAPSSTQLKTFVAKDIKKSTLFPNWILNYEYQNLETVILDESEFEFFEVLNVENFPVKVKHFSIRQSNLTDKLFSWATKNMIELETLDIGNRSNGGNVIPEIKFEGENLLKDINFENVGLSTFPDFVGNFCHVTKVNMSNNNISWLPPNFTDLKNLEILNAENCQLISLPDDFGKLSKLKELHVPGNYITSLPDSMKEIKKLEIFDLFENQLYEFPEVLGELESLRALDLDQNFFDTKDLEVGGKLLADLQLALRNEKKCIERPMGFRVNVENESDGCYSDEQSDDSRFEIDSNKASTHKTRNPSSDENWDESEDSMDDFDPNAPKIPRKRKTSLIMQTQLERQNYMCPAAYHEKSVIDQINLQIVLGDRELQYVEGQFDDP